MYKVKTYNTVTITKEVWVPISTLRELLAVADGYKLDGIETIDGRVLFQFSAVKPKKEEGV